MLCERADEHRIAGWLFTKLEKHPAARSVPADVMARWKQSYLKQWARSRFLTAELARLDVELERAGIDVLHMKGALVGLRLHGRLDARAVSDIDILLRREGDVQRAESCLVACGYRRSSRLLGSHAVTRAFTYQLEYWKGELPVELHWSLQRDPSLRFDPEEMWQRSETVEVDGRTCRVLSAEDTTVAYAVSVAVDLRIGKLTARTLLEVYLLLRDMPEGFDWRTWRARREREGTLRVFAAVVSSALELFGPDARLDEVSRALAPHLDERDRDVVLEALSAPESLGSWRRRLGALRLLDGSIASALGWWAMSLPARMLAHPGRPRARRRPL